MNPSDFHIVDHPLPLNQDFDALTRQGREYIEQLCGENWTNMNPSDPGVTILDQVCYALTELGYCNDFPIEDILTKPDGELMVKNQFFLPEEILTTSPVTERDFQKVVTQALPLVRKIILRPKKEQSYLIEVKLIVASTDASIREMVRRECGHLLNRFRNLGTKFLPPTLIPYQTARMPGKIVLAKKVTGKEAAFQIQEAVDEILFSKQHPRSMREVSEAGMDWSHVFNGPQLADGWLPGPEATSPHALPDLAEVISRLLQLNLIAEIPELKLEIAPGGLGENASGSISVSIPEMLATGSLQLYHEGEEILWDSEFPESEESISFPDPSLASVDRTASLPQGNFRDISSYDSIQFTFPDIYGVGQNSLGSNAADWKIAQSRQLKGYLTLFDQVLANQFAQLANVGELFSFRNSITSRPLNRKALVGSGGQTDRKRLTFPAPYLEFSPTYYFKSLYDVPQIRDILAGTEAFDFGYASESPDRRENSSWEAYQEDPYNAYMRSVPGMMEGEEEQLNRREAMLDHLLARHGESPSLLNQLIKGSVFQGDSRQDRIIYKSLYLQNLATLGYYRDKGYNFQTARRLKEDLLPKKDSGIPSYNRDAIFDSRSVDQLMHINQSDYTDYSAFELKLSLLLGLETVYENFIADEWENPALKKETELARWLIRERKGLVLIENVLRLPEDLNSGAKEEKLSGELAAGGTKGNLITLVFPDFIPAINSLDFKKRLQIFIENCLPLHLDCQTRFRNASALTLFRKWYIPFHNSLIFSNKPTRKNSSDPENAAHALGKWLLENREETP